MYQLKHHGFFKVYLPKNKDPENMDWTEVFMEESHLHYNGEITTGYEYDQGDRTILDIDLLPSYIYLAWYSNQNNSTGQFQHINQTIDRLFVKKLLQFNPIYRCTGFIDYHFHHFIGEKALFFKHLRHQIIPLCEIILEEFKNDKAVKSNIPKFNTVKEIIEEWVVLNNKNNNESKIISRLKSFNWWQIIGTFIAFTSLIIALIVDLDIIKKFFESILK